MSTSAQLRKNTAQHAPKNVLSKGDDRKIAVVMDRVITHLDSRFKLTGLGFRLEYVKSIKLSELVDIIKSYDKRSEFARLTKQDSFIKPDGGILLLREAKDEKYKRIALAVEAQPVIRLARGEVRIEQHRTEARHEQCGRENELLLQALAAHLRHLQRVIPPQQFEFARPSFVVEFR